MSDKPRESFLITWKKFNACWIGQTIGAFLGYCISFFFQHELIRLKLGFGGYLTHFFDVIDPTGNGPSQIWLTAWFFLIAGAIGGGSTQMKLVEKGRIPKPGRWKKLEEKTDGEQSGSQPPTPQQKD